MSWRAHTRLFMDCFDQEEFKASAYDAFYSWFMLDLIIGRGSGKLMTESIFGLNPYNSDIRDPPYNLLTGKPIESWYRPGQTYTRIFGDIVASVDKC